MGWGDSFGVVRASVRATDMDLGGLFSCLEIDKGPFLNKGPWPSVSFCKLPQMIQGPSGKVIK